MKNSSLPTGPDHQLITLWLDNHKQEIRICQLQEAKVPQLFKIKDPVIIGTSRITETLGITMMKASTTQIMEKVIVRKPLLRLLGKKLSKSNQMRTLNRTSPEIMKLLNKGSTSISRLINSNTSITNMPTSSSRRRTVQHRGWNLNMEVSTTWFHLFKKITERMIKLWVPTRDHMKRATIQNCIQDKAMVRERATLRNIWSGRRKEELGREQLRRLRPTSMLMLPLILPRCRMYGESSTRNKLGLSRIRSVRDQNYGISLTSLKYLY